MQSVFFKIKEQLEFIRTCLRQFEGEAFDVQMAISEREPALLLCHRQQQNHIATLDQLLNEGKAYDQHWHNADDIEPRKSLF